MMKELVFWYDLSKPGEANTVEYEAEFLRGIVKKDFRDGKFFLDYMKQYNEFDEPALYYDYILRTKDFIIRNLDAYSGVEKLYKKYEWLRWYYNETVCAVYGREEQLLI